MTAEPSIGDLRVPRVSGRRGAILRHAADLASLDGLEQISIGRLASAMEMSKSGLYAYFSSKQSLQLATIDCAWRIFEEHVLEPGNDPLEALVERWISYYEQEIFPGGCPLVTAGTEFANRDGPVHDALAAAIERQLANLEEALARVHAVQMLDDSDSSQLAFELHAILIAGNQRYRMSRDRAAFAQARRAIARLLAGDPPQPPRGGEGSSAIEPAPFDSAAETGSDLIAIDHVALAVADVAAMQTFLCEDVGMRELGRDGDGVLVGADPRATTLCLIAAAGSTEPAALARLVLRVPEPRTAAASLSPASEAREAGPDLVAFEGPEGLGLGFTSVAGGGLDHDIDHLVLRVADPEQTRIALAEVGFVPRGDALHVADKRILLEELPAWSDRPLLHHIAVRVASTERVLAHARQRGLEIDGRSSGRVTIVLAGLERIRLQFVAASARSS